MKQYVFFVEIQKPVLAALIFPERYVRCFSSLHPAFEMSCDAEYLKKQLLIFSETWSPSFCFVYNCFDDFRTNLPKKIGRFHRKGNTNFSKWRWVRSKTVCLSSALLFSLVLTKKYVLRTSWGISARSNTCFLFKCRVTFHLRFFLNATFATLALSSCVWDVLWYRRLIKTAFVSWAKQKLSKTTLSTFQKGLFELRWARFFGCI